MFEKLKEKQREDATNISKMTTQLQLLALRLEDIEFQISRMEQTGKSELAENVRIMSTETSKPRSKGSHFRISSLFFIRMI